MLIFLSYQTKDKHIAGKVSGFFESIGVQTFLAHENIRVTQKWQETILANLGEMDIFVALVSKNYCASDYCLQESGIAVMRGADVTIAPLSLDGTLPPGFMAHIQAARIDERAVDESVLFSIIANYNIKFAIDLLIRRLADANSYVEAERRFETLSVYLQNAERYQIVEILKAAVRNNQISGCWACQPSLRNMLETHGRFISAKDREYLAGRLT